MIEQGAAVMWVCAQVSAYMSGWLGEHEPTAGYVWDVLKVRPLGRGDSYHWLFESRYPQSHEIRLLVFSNCGSFCYRLDVVSFDADRMGAQIQVIPITSYAGEAVLA